MNNVKDSVSEICVFIEGLTFSSPLKSTDNNRSYSSAYRFVHALLIWDHILNSSKKKKPSVDALTQFRELLSDLSSAQLLTLCGLYKPARMMLRSSIENMLRVSAIELGFFPSKSKFSHELISLVKSSRLGVSPSPVEGDLNYIINTYKKLCAYTHASSKEYLSLKVPLVAAVQFNQAEYDSIISDLRTLASRYNRIVFSLYEKPLAAAASHRHRDFVLDALPKSLKAYFSA